jgi:2-oxoglutarate dehydrogenase E2 component (dihydrolipoamide succinyltransferase)
MQVEIKVPTLGESVSEATVAKWFKKVGDAVAADEPLCELETDKVTLELNAPSAGSLADIAVEEGGEVEVGAILGHIDDSAEGAPAKEAEPKAATAGNGEAAVAEKPAPAPRQEAPPEGGDGALSPAVRKLLDEHGINPAEVQSTGPKGNLTKGDVLAFIEAKTKPEAEPEAKPAAEEQATRPAPAPEQRAEPPRPTRPQPPKPPTPAPRAGTGGREERIKMSRLRRRIAERLKDAQNTAAILTTYNEADMSEVMALRKRYRDVFEQKHGVRLGFMSFFVKAAVSALQAYPAVNAEIDGDELVYKYYYDIGVAVGSPQGLVVPVLRDADQKSLAEIETTINGLGIKARDGKLGMDDLMGGTFTISNGGVYGSLMSSPILNPPQVGILGMHKIQERPMVVEGQIVARPMMYLALSYDHRIVDGREAVSFLVRIKECIENPERLLLAV